MDLDSQFIHQIIKEAMIRHNGNIFEINHAIGWLMTGLYIGWRPMRLLTAKKTFRNYEKILNIEFKNVMPEVGPMADNLAAWRFYKEKKGNFWKLVTGERPIPNRQYYGKEDFACETNKE